MLFRERGRRGVLLAIEGVSGETPWSGTQRLPATQQKRIDATVFVDLPANGSRQFVVKLPSPLVPDGEGADADGDRLREGARGDAGVLVGLRRTRRAVPACRSSAVNDLFRASLWHALRLPRRHGGAERRTSPSICRTRTSPTARPARRGRSIRPCTWTTCSTTCAAITRSRPRSSRRSSATTRRSRRSCRRLRQLAGLHAGDALCGRAELPALERSRGLRTPAAAEHQGHGLVPRRRSRARSRDEGAGTRPRARPAQRPDRRRASGPSTRRISSRGSICSAARSNGTATRAPPRRGRRPRAIRDVDRARLRRRQRCDRRSSSCATARGRPTCRPKRSRRGGCSTSGTRPTWTPAPSICCA